MTTSTPATRGEFVHAAATYGSDDELLDVIVPHLQAGVRAGQPVFAALPDRELALVRAAIGEGAPVTFWPALGADTRPPAVVKTLTTLLDSLQLPDGALVHVVQAVPHPGIGASWDGWCRYEAALNDLLAPLPLSGLCVYDRRTTPGAVLDDVDATHPLVMGSDGEHRVNDRYQAPAAFLRSRPPPPPDPAEADAPAIELVDPDPATARRAVRDVAARAGFPAHGVEQLVVATSEAVTNALVHGRPPVLVRSWARPGRVLVTVTDHGPGPADPAVGLVPGHGAAAGAGGYGLWLIDQLVTATHAYTPDGFTLRLVIGPPLAAR